MTDRTDDDEPSADPDDEWDPSDGLGLTYNCLLEALRLVRCSVSDTASARKVVEFQVQQLEDQVDEPAVSSGSFRAVIEEQIADLKEQLNEIGTRFENLVLVAAQFQRDVERFRVEKELLKASYTAVKALTMMGDAVRCDIGPDPGP